MRSRISAIIITKKEIDESKIQSRNEFYEKGFDLKIMDSCDGICDVLSDFYGVDCIITIGNDLDLDKLSALPMYIRTKWVHVDDLDELGIGDCIIDTFIYNLNRKDVSSKKFSIFMSAYNTDKDKLMRLYQSLLNQTYGEWNLWILDDSSEDNTNVSDFVSEINDYRINFIKNVNRHGNIGFNKHLIAMACDGDYLLEMDHDDYLTPDCLELIHEAFVRTNCDFVYGYVIELSDGRPVLYGDKWGYGGYGYIDECLLDGKRYKFSVTPDINAYTIRTIYTQPNHPRCWRKDFYHKIGGHDINLSVLDDQDILVRTFLNGTMCKVPKVLYVQDEGERKEGSGDTTQSKRFNEIQRTCQLLKFRYDRLIHERLLSLGHEDPCWDDEKKYSDLEKESEPLMPINKILCL